MIVRCRFSTDFNYRLTIWKHLHRQVEDFVIGTSIVSGQEQTSLWLSIVDSDFTGYRLGETVAAAQLTMTTLSKKSASLELLLASIEAKEIRASVKYEEAIQSSQVQKDGRYLLCVKWVYSSSYCDWKTVRWKRWLSVLVLIMISSRHVCVSAVGAMCHRLLNFLYYCLLLFFKQ